MKYKTVKVKEFFAKEFSRCCAERYLNIPSNEQLSKDLYVSSKYSLKVSRETIRKWLKGETFPDLDCLLHLIDWLGLNMSNVFLDSGGDSVWQIDKSKIGGSLNSSSNNLTSEQIDSIVNILNTIKKNQLNEKNKS
jgi:hypothetical protein